MKRIFFRGLLVSLFATGLGAAAHAQEPDRLIVNVPYNFVAAGKALPAGTYKIQRNSDSSLRVLVLIDAERRTSVVALPYEVRDVNASRPGVTLQQAGDQRFLTRIRTGDHIFVFPLSNPALEAIAKAERANYVSGTSESQNH